MSELDTTIACIAGFMLVVFFIHQEVLFGRMIKQNSKFVQDADKRLSKANEMVLTLAHSADELSKSVSHLKDMMVHLEQVYTSRTDTVIKNRDEFRDAYLKLLTKYEELEAKHEEMMQKSFGTLRELARRPSITNNNIPESSTIG